MAIEYYKDIHGVYPSELMDIVGPGHRPYFTSFLQDVSGQFRGAIKRRTHQYQLLPDRLHYTLFDSGLDGISGTDDDIYPILLPEEIGHTGYISKEESEKFLMGAGNASSGGKAKLTHVPWGVQALR